MTRLSLTMLTFGTWHLSILSSTDILVGIPKVLTFDTLPYLLCVIIHEWRLFIHMNARHI